MERARKRKKSDVLPSLLRDVQKYLISFLDKEHWLKYAVVNRVWQSACQQQLVSLYKDEMVLLLYHNQLTQIPKELGNLTQLKRLSLYHNQLTQIPKELGNLTQLKRLYLHVNQLTQIPKELGNLTQLERLYLEHNQLTRIPEELAHVVNISIMLKKQDV